MHREFVGGMEGATTVVGGVEVATMVVGGVEVATMAVGGMEVATMAVEVATMAVEVATTGVEVAAMIVEFVATNQLESGHGSAHGEFRNIYTVVMRFFILNFLCVDAIFETMASAFSVGGAHHSHRLNWARLYY